MTALGRWIPLVLMVSVLAIGVAWCRELKVFRYTAAGAALFEAEDYQESLSAYLRALRLKPEDPSILYNVGCVRIRLGDIMQAVRDLEAAAEQSRDTCVKASAHYNLGTIWLREARRRQTAGGAASELEVLYHRSVENFRSALRWDPSHPKASSALAAAKRSWNAMRLARDEGAPSAVSEKSRGESNDKKGTGGAETMTPGGEALPGDTVESPKPLSILAENVHSPAREPSSREKTAASAAPPGESVEGPSAYHPSLSRTPLQRSGPPLDLSSPEQALEQILALEETPRGRRMPAGPLRIDVTTREW